MSKLRDLIRDIGRRKPAAFGFAAMRSGAATDHPRQLLVIAEVADAADASAAATATVDAVLYTGAASNLAAVVAAVQAAGSKAPVGIRINAATGADATAVAEAGADFLAFDDASADGASVSETRLGYLALVSPETDDATVRLLRLLDLDGVLVAAPPEQMTVRQQLQTRRMAELARKPLIARAEAAVSAAALERWRDAGVAAIVAPVPAVAALVAAAAEVPPRREPKQQGRPDAIVPAPRSSSDDEEDDE